MPSHTRGCYPSGPKSFLIRKAPCERKKVGSVDFFPVKLLKDPPNIFRPPFWKLVCVPAGKEEHNNNNNNNKILSPSPLVFL
mmetsp:Transcript_1152/g.2978  ORF Transcript_1152/g.2978 Transcript_1152/m.2978 type:complete len:82 (-) Transcript_1152:358-603(-)